MNSSLFRLRGERLQINFLIRVAPWATNHSPPQPLKAAICMSICPTRSLDRGSKQ
jgi:hypothetical protein